jgi:hypothetical protein
MDLLADSIPLESETLTGEDALEALAAHRPIQRLCRGHDAVLWFSPSLEWWLMSKAVGYRWEPNPGPNSPLGGAKDAQGCEREIRAWWARCGNGYYEWTIYQGELPDEQPMADE